MSSLKRKRDAWRDRCPASVTFHALTIVIVSAVCAFAARAAVSLSALRSHMSPCRSAASQHTTAQATRATLDRRRVAPSTEVLTGIRIVGVFFTLNPRVFESCRLQYARVRHVFVYKIQLHCLSSSQCTPRRQPVPLPAQWILKKITYGYAHTHPHLPRPTTPHCRPPAGLTLAAPRRRRGRAYQAIARPSRPYVAKLHNSPSAPPNCTTRAAQEAHPIHRWQMRCLKGLGGYETPRPCWDREIIDCD